MQLSKPSCSFFTSGDEQLKLRLMVSCRIPQPMEKKHTPKSPPGHLGEEDNLIPFGHKGIDLLGTGNQLITDIGERKEGVRLNFLSASFQKLIHLQAKG